MRRATVVLAGVALAACGTASGQPRTVSTAARPATASCTPAGAPTLASDREAAVYRLSGSVYACSVQGSKRIKLGSATFCVATTRVDHAALAAQVLAYGAERCGVDTGGASVLVRRLPDGKQLNSYASITIGLLPESYQAVTSIVVRRDGAVAWIATVHSIIGRGSRTAVYRNGSLLDSGTGIVATSLRLRGTTLSWTHGSGTRTATLR